MNLLEQANYFLDEDSITSDDVLQTDPNDSANTDRDRLIAIGLQIKKVREQMAELKKRAQKIRKPNLRKFEIAKVKVLQDRLNDLQLRQKDINSSYEFDDPELFEDEKKLVSALKNMGVSEKKAKSVATKAVKAKEENPKYKHKSKEDKAKIALGIAKKMAGVNEDGASGGIPAAVPQTGGGMAGSALNTTTSIGGKFYAPIMPIQSHQEEFKEKKKKKKKSRRVKESVTEYIDNLFNE
jgi:hypothetical protein